MKLVYLVLDGAADRLSDPVTSLGMAKKPYLDLIARAGVCGVVYTVGKGIAPESDAAVMSILGYDPRTNYTGRGPIEAIGAGISFVEGHEVAFRANFATIDPSSRKIIDRRVGRSLSTEEASKLAEALDGLRLSNYGGYVRVKATVGHRAVVVIGSDEIPLSDEVDNTDPAYRKVGSISVAEKNPQPYIKKSTPLSPTLSAQVTAELVNEFTLKSIEILDKHPINRAREEKGLLKANVILVRDAGSRLPKLLPINKLFNISFGSVTEMPVENGIAKLLGMRAVETPPPTEDKASDYFIRLEATLKLLNEVDVVYVHLKGPDEPGHDGNLHSKVKSIEDIDKFYVKELLGSIDLKEVAILVTSDHATPPSIRAHTDDPVPILLAGGRVVPDKVLRLEEKECYELGSIGILNHGWEILPRILNMIMV
ncbi:MAG: alkaline phosphatase family protein [Desulfurococcaceae archaeon TW002]